MEVIRKANCKNLPNFFDIKIDFYKYIFLNFIIKLTMIDFNQIIPMTIQCYCEAHIFQAIEISISNFDRTIFRNESRLMQNVTSLSLTLSDK